MDSLEARVAVIESTLKHIESDITDMKKDLRTGMWFLFGTLITVVGTILATVLPLYFKISSALSHH